MIKKSFVFGIFVIFLSTMVLASSIDIEFPLGDNFKAGEKITMKVTVFDDQKNPIDGEVSLNFKDAGGVDKIEEIVSSKEIVEIDLGENAFHGFWTVTAKYQDVETNEIFTIEIEELAKFEIHDNLLKVTNIGNTRYSKTIQIVIGSTIGIKDPRLNVGESIEYRLIAPEGDYEVRVSDGTTSIQRNNVALTGNAIGVLDERIIGGNTITGGVKTDDENSISYLKTKNFGYIFVMAITGAMVLLAIERHYKRRVKK